jgi:Flp pilus assembly protein TadG
MNSGRSWRWLPWWRATASDGNAPLELVLLAPIILMMIGFVIAAGRVSTAQGAVDAAAHDAARQASLAPSQAAAESAAISSANAALAADGLQCQPTVTLPNLGAAFASQIGQSAEIQAEVVCVVQLSSLFVPGLPGSLRLTGSFSSPLDPYRSRNLAAADWTVVTALSHRGSHTQGSQIRSARGAG